MMTNREIELSIQNINKTISELAKVIYNGDSDNEEKCQKNEIDISTTNTKTEENRESIAMVDDTMSVLTEEIIPSIEIGNIETSDIVDTIMTEVIPSIVEMVESALGVTDEEE